MSDEWKVKACASDVSGVISMIVNVKADTKEDAKALALTVLSGFVRDGVRITITKAKKVEKYTKVVGNKSESDRTFNVNPIVSSSFISSGVSDNIDEGMDIQREHGKPVNIGEHFRESVSEPRPTYKSGVSNVIKDSVSRAFDKLEKKYDANTSAVDDFIQGSEYDDTNEVIIDEGALDTNEGEE